MIVNLEDDNKTMSSVINYAIVSILIIQIGNCADTTYEIDCNNLRMGQYICPHPDYELIDPKTQQPKGCTKENKAKGTRTSLKFYYFY